MGTANMTMNEDYWDSFSIEEQDIEFLYNYLLETEIPLNTRELINALIKERIERRRAEIERQRMSGGDLYLPKLQYKLDQKLIFPTLNWKQGKVVASRQGENPDLGEFQVVKVAFEDGNQREFASHLENHKLNEQPVVAQEFQHIDERTVLRLYGNDLEDALEEELSTNPDFVRIAGRWFPRALLIDINVGHLNIAEAVLDMAGGGPLTTLSLFDQLELRTDVNPKLQEFSMDLALQEDERFDEVGPAGDVQWFLKRLEPIHVTSTPVFLRYQELEHSRTILTDEMLQLEQSLDDELSPLKAKEVETDDIEVKILFPHWRTGTLPLSNRTKHLFPTAYEAPRVLFTLIDGETQERFSGWVVRAGKYVYGLEEWYESHGVIPGTIIQIRRGKVPGEVVVQVDNHRPVREWIRTLLVGSDGGTVYAMLKQIVTTPIDERMAIAIPDKNALDPVWQKPMREQPALENLVINNVRDLARLNPQSHVHFVELYSAINTIRRVPPAPIMAVLAANPAFVHVGDMHFRLSDTDSN
jgi:hypothetical protein